MLDSFQALTRADAATARFLATFIAVLVPLYLLSALYSRFVPRPSAPSTHGRKPLQSHIQRTAKSVAVRFANWVASLPIAPNQITLIGLALVVFCCALFLYHRNSFIFGTSLIVAYLFDTLDGVVARAKEVLAPERPLDGYAREEAAWASLIDAPAARQLMSDALANGAQTPAGEADLEGLMRSVAR